eukprot:77791-Prymnesium_polylepis.1
MATTAGPMASLPAALSRSLTSSMLSSSCCGEMARETPTASSLATTSDTVRGRGHGGRLRAPTWPRRGGVRARLWRPGRACVRLRVCVWGCVRVLRAWCARGARAWCARGARAWCARGARAWAARVVRA